VEVWVGLVVQVAVSRVAVCPVVVKTKKRKTKTQARMRRGSSAD
jgi:hypothetical protein